MHPMEITMRHPNNHSQSSLMLLVVPGTSALLIGYTFYSLFHIVSQYIISLNVPFM